MNKPSVGRVKAIVFSSLLHLLVITLIAHVRHRSPPPAPSVRLSIFQPQALRREESVAASSAAQPAASAAKQNRPRAKGTPSKAVVPKVIAKDLPPAPADAPNLMDMATDSEVNPTQSTPPSLPNDFLDGVDLGDSSAATTTGAPGGNAAPGTAANGIARTEANNASSPSGGHGKHRICAEPVALAVPDEQSVYPEAAKRARHQGTVILRLAILPDGLVGHVNVVVGAGYGLDEAAKEALRGARFAPARRCDGQPIARTITYRFVFSMV